MKNIKYDFTLQDAFQELDNCIVDNKSTLRTRPFVRNQKNLHEELNPAKKTESLIEEYIDINDSKELEKAYQERAEEQALKKLAKIEKIVDLDADNANDLQKSYAGKYIIQCPDCLTIFYKDHSNLVQDNIDKTLYNVGEACQHCGNVDGYDLLGKVSRTTEFDTEASAEDLDSVELDLNNEEENLEDEEQNIDAEEENLEDEEQNIDTEEENLEDEEQNIDTEEENLEDEEQNVDDISLEMMEDSAKSINNQEKQEKDKAKKESIKIYPRHASYDHSERLSEDFDSVVVDGETYVPGKGHFVNNADKEAFISFMKDFNKDFTFNEACCTKSCNRKLRDKIKQANKLEESEQSLPNSIPTSEYGKYFKKLVTGNISDAETKKDLNKIKTETILTDIDTDSLVEALKIKFGLSIQVQDCFQNSLTEHFSIVGKSKECSKSSPDSIVLHLINPTKNKIMHEGLTESIRIHGKLNCIKDGKIVKAKPLDLTGKIKGDKLIFDRF